MDGLGVWQNFGSKAEVVAFVVEEDD